MNTLLVDWRSNGRGPTSKNILGAPSRRFSGMTESIGPMWSCGQPRNRVLPRRQDPIPGKRTRREDHDLLIVHDEFRPAIP